MIATLKARTGLGYLRLARLLGVSREAVFRWCKGASPPQSVQDQVERLLSLNPDQLSNVVTLLAMPKE